jgi:hypothetical protein
MARSTDNVEYRAMALDVSVGVWLQKITAQVETK